MATVEDITLQLERALANATAKIDEFVEAQTFSLTKAASDHEQLMRDLEGRMQRLLEEEAAANSSANASLSVLAQERQRAAEAQAELLKVEVQAKAVPVELDAARAAEAAARGQLDRQREEYDRRESDVRYQLNELTKGISFYRRLGLDFDKINDERLRLVFTQIDPASPDRRFCFNVRVTDAEAYEVDSIDPPVPGIDSLVRELNEGNDFSSFVQRMRGRFKDLVAKEHAPAQDN